MSSLSVHDIQGISNYNNTVRVPTGHKLEIEKELKIPVWTTPTRPANPSQGIMGYNTTTGVLEVYDGTLWKPINKTEDGGSEANSLAKPSALDSSVDSSYRYIDWNNTAYYGYVDNSSLGPATNFGTATRGWLRVAKEEFVAWSQSGSNIFLPQGRYVQEVVNNATRWRENQYDGVLAVFAIRLPDWVQGIHIEKFQLFSINGPDGQNGGSSVSDANIWSAFQGNTVSLGGNYATFELSVATASNQFARLYNNGNADGWTTEVNSAYLNLTGNSFTTYNGMSSFIGPTGKYLIFNTSDGTTETYRLEDFTFWLHG